MDEKKSLFDYYSVQEITENFSLEEVLNFAKQKNLGEWLETNFYTTESQQIYDAVENEIGDAKLKLLICKIFNFDLNNLSAVEVEEIAETVTENQNKKLLLNGHENDDRKFAVVKTQGELVKALRDGVAVVYLCDGEFKIPHNVNGKTYIGRNNAIIDLTLTDDVDFDERDIIFEDLQIFLHYPVTLRINKSKNVKLIDGSRQTLEDFPTLQEIFEILRGRNSFESEELFKKRAENIRGAAVGNVLLNQENYNVETQNFDLKPNWNFEYISVMKNYAENKNFSIKISPEDAEKLYNNERKLQIFADFTVKDGKITILRLYFVTATLGKIFVDGYAESEKNIFSSGSGFGLGYGLHIITAYKDEIAEEKE